MATMADQIRAEARKKVERARKAHQTTLKIRVGDIAKELKLNDRVPNICSALSDKAFQKENGIVLESRDGPSSGQSTTTIMTYRFIEASATDSLTEQFKALRGIGRKMFEELGGGEEFIRSERESFYAR